MLHLALRPAEGAPAPSTWALVPGPRMVDNASVRRPDRHSKLAIIAVAAAALTVASTTTSCSSFFELLGSGASETTAPRASPSGDVIAFTRRANDTWSLFTIHPDGTELTKLLDIVSVAKGPPSDYLDLLGQPAWSP